MLAQPKYLQIRINLSLFIAIALLAASLVFQFSADFKASAIVNEISHWLAMRPETQSWSGRVSKYGLYVVANIELITFFFLIISPLRRLGAGLGVLFASATLLIYLLVSINSTAWVVEQGLVFSSFWVALIVVFTVVCAWFFQLTKKMPPVLDEREKAWKMELEKELADEVMGQKPVTAFSELPNNISSHTKITNEVEEAYKQLLMNVTGELSEEIEGEHRRVLLDAQNKISTLPAEHKYFPRQPMIIPKLVRAVNNETSSKKNLVDVISQDIVIAGELLRVANSPYYKLTEGSIDSIGRAILVLGIKGLRSLTSALVLQPVSQTDKIYFPGFTKRVWVHSILAANAAQAYARKTRSCDSFTAHLLGLLSSVGHIVILQMLLDVYKHHSGIRPKIEVLNKLQKDHADEVSVDVIESWQLSKEFVDTIKAYQRQGNINDLSSLGRALYYGRLCASLFLLYKKQRYSEEQVREVVHEQGLHPEVFEAMWKVLNEGEGSLSDVWG